MTKMHLGVLIGRFQPLHLGHCHLIEKALQHCDELVIVIGSANRARNFKNPWTIAERQALIQSHFANAPLHFAAIPDFFYAETAWTDAVKASTRLFKTDKITLFGYDKDYSSYYLQEFPAWTYHAIGKFEEIDATTIREEYFLGELISTHIPIETYDFLTAFQQTPEFARLAEEARFVRAYQQSWQHSPYPPIFVTADAFVLCNQHLLLIKRKFCPGKGLYALPGGFLESNEWIRTGIVRELIEETSIGLDKASLMHHLKTIQIFDYPDRSLIGRVITHVGCFELPTPFPNIKAADDALSVEWLPVSQLKSCQDQFHDDHYQIITTLLDRIRL